MINSTFSYTSGKLGSSPERLAMNQGDGYRTMQEERWVETTYLRFTLCKHWHLTSLLFRHALLKIVQKLSSACPSNEVVRLWVTGIMSFRLYINIDISVTWSMLPGQLLYSIFVYCKLSTLDGGMAWEWGWGIATDMYSKPRGLIPLCILEEEVASVWDLHAVLCFIVGFHLGPGLVYRAGPPSLAHPKLGAGLGEEEKEI